MNITINIKEERIADLIETALNHIGYWCEITSCDIIKKHVESGEREELAVVLSEGRIILQHIDPDNGDKLETLTWDHEAVKRGLKLMVEEHAHQFAQFMSEQGDMVTGDVFAQCCLLGEVRYG